MYINVVKRFFDIILSLMGLPLLLLILAFFAPIIYLTDHGPIFYSALRLGKDGKLFRMYKLRSMIVNAPDLRNEDGSTFNSSEDRRMTKIGRFMRITSLDETPQILNVLKGDMSIVGPRPDLPDALGLYNAAQKLKLKMRPGITGFNQAFCRNSIRMDRRFDNDIFYVNHASFLFDLIILVKTVGSVLQKKHIFASGSESVPAMMSGGANRFGRK